jgi:hypothetical protein
MTHFKKQTSDRASFPSHWSLLGAFPTTTNATINMALDVGRASQILTDGFFKRRGMNIFSYFLEQLETYLSLEVDFPKLDKLGYRSYRQEKENKGTTVFVMRKELPKVVNVSQQQQSQDQEKNQVEKERKRNTQVYSKRKDQPRHTGSSSRRQGKACCKLQL